MRITRAAGDRTIKDQSSAIIRTTREVQRSVNEMTENNQDPSLLMSVKDRIQSAYDTKELSDCQLSVGASEVLFKAHKFVMSLSSPVFKAMFHGDLAETGDAPIRVTDIEPDGFSGMLHFMYTDNIDFTSPKHAAQVLVAATKYIIPYLVTMCDEHINHTLYPTMILDVLDLYKFSVLHNMEDVANECVEHLKRNTTLILDNEKYKEVDLSIVKLIIQQNELNIGSETELCKAVEQWAVREADKREVTLDVLLPELEDVICSFRFKTMSLEDLPSCVLKSSLLSTEEKGALYLNKVDCSMFPYPKQFSTDANKRLQCISKNKEWVLERKWKIEGKLIITKSVNLFPEKSFTVSRPIKLIGLYLEHFGMDVKIIEGNRVISSVINNQVSKIVFPQPAVLQPKKVYWIEITTEGSYYGNYCDDISTTYKLNNMTITMSDHYSQVKKMFFLEL